MECNATIENISLSPDGTGSGINYQVQVQFNDPTSGFTQVKTYAFPSTETILAAKTAIQTDLNGFKTIIAAASNLQNYVGTVLT